MPEATDSIPTAVVPYLEEIEAMLADRLESVLRDDDVPKGLAEACRYAVLGGGKRLRPLLTVLCCEAVNGNRSDAMTAGASCEFIHAFSLVHDDLPAMDDDDLRRGQPTVHRKFGEAMAILAGDALQTQAFAMITCDSLPAAVQAALVGELARATSAMITGQVLDTLGGFPAEMSDRERIERIHRAKTGALIRAACRMGAIAGGASAESLQAVNDYGEAVGLMFQIVDDLLDVTQTSEHLGKLAGKDTGAGKLTFPNVIGVEASKDEVARLHGDAIEAAGSLAGPGAAHLIEVADFLAVRTR